MISIITAVHNQLAVNRVFLDTLQKNTSTAYELIIVDNHSTDGSLELFEQAGAKIIKNPENHCYPDSQNMGMAIAKGDYFAFLNNDIYLAPNWDKEMIQAMEEHSLDIASLGGFEVLENPLRRRKYFQRWKWLRRGRRHLKMNTEQLKKLVDKVYGRKGFEAWSLNEAREQQGHIYLGLNGSAVLTTRKAWDLLEKWDVQMEGADWDLAIRTGKMSAEVGNIKPAHIIPSALHHHFSRVTFHSVPEPRICDHSHRKIEDKWTPEEIQKYGPHLPQDTSWRSDVRRWVKKLRITRKKIDREKVE